VLVVVTGTAESPVVLDRKRVELVDESLPRQPYHAVAEAGLPRSVIDAAAQVATSAVVQELRSHTGVEVVAVVASERRIPSSIEQILRSHALLHAAEGQLFERAVMVAAGNIGLPVYVAEPKFLEVTAAVDTLGRSIGPPWQKDHKRAATAALVALGSG
jgi:hypothetical protein